MSGSKKNEEAEQKTAMMAKKETAAANPYNTNPFTAGKKSL